MGLTTDKSVGRSSYNVRFSGRRHSIRLCESAKVQKDENEMVFPEEPKMKIIADTNLLYSKYVSEIYPGVAYHDEPRFLKIQELIKLILAAEWLTEKGVRVSKK